MTRLFISLMFLFFGAFAQKGICQNERPEVVINTFEYFEMNDSIYIEYTIADPDNNVFDVFLLVSEDDKMSFKVPIMNTTGDIGKDIVDKGIKKLSATIAPSSIDGLNARIIVSDQETIDVQDIVDQVDQDRIYSHMQFIEGARHRISSPMHLQETRDYIQTTLEQDGQDIAVLPFDFGSYTGENFIGTQSGMFGDGDYYVGGHYDSVSDTPGADDNATAIAAMLEVSRVLSAYDFEKNIKYVAWDLEESGLKGSLDYVNNQLENKEEIIGYLNFEMLGYYKDVAGSQSLPVGFDLLFPMAYEAIAKEDFKGDFLVNVGNESNSMELMNDFAMIAETYVPSLRVISIASPGNGSQVDDLLRSDHAAFWGKEIPALMLTDAADFRNPNYHTPLDVLDSLDMEFLTNNTKASVAFLAEKASYLHAGKAEFEASIILSDNTIQSVDSEIILYPNPVSNWIRLDTQSMRLHDIRSLRLFDAQGVLVKDFDVSKIDLNSGTVYLPDLLPGNYHLNVQNGKINTSFKLVIQ